jgi:hypothetical protein
LTDADDEMALEAAINNLSSPIFRRQFINDIQVGVIMGAALVGD